MAVSRGTLGLLLAVPVTAGALVSTWFAADDPWLADARATVLAALHILAPALAAAL